MHVVLHYMQVVSPSIHYENFEIRENTGKDMEKLLIADQKEIREVSALYLMFSHQ